MKQTIKNIGKVLLVLLVIFNLLYLFRINYSVDYLKDSFQETSTLTNELKLLKGDLIPEGSNTTQDSTLVSTIISKLDQYNINQQSQNSLQELQTFLSTANQLQLPENYTITNKLVNSFQITSDENQTLISVSYDPLSQILTLKSFHTEQTYNIYEFSEFQEEFQSLIQEESLLKEKALSANFQKFLDLQSLLQNHPQANLLETKQLELIPAFYKNQTAYIDFLKAGEYMVSISSDLNNDDQQYYIKNQQNQLLLSSNNQDEVINYFYGFLDKTTFQTLIEQNIESKISYILQTLNDQNLQDSLEEKDFSISEPVNTNLRYEISILDSLNQQVLAIRIDKQDAKTYLIFQNEEAIIDFKDLKFELPEIEKDTENHLILGKHGSLTDTIIVANFDNINKEVKLISLPRDLYIENKKINSLYLYKGLEGLIREVESITGLQVDKYALVDMYTFIDVVDTLGGIDVELSKPLVDPSYTTFDNNEWGTLKLSAGEHNVNGRQALRIARSRYSTSDFDRAQRQHLILDGLKNRIKELGAKDAKTITELALLGVESTETNLNLKDVLSYYGKYKDYELKDSVVLSTANVLVSTYTGALNGTNSNATEEAQNKGAYILLPKNQDWFLIRTFIYRFLSR